MRQSPQAYSGCWKGSAAVLGFLGLFWMFFPMILPGCEDHSAAREVSCVSNLKQIGLGLAQYAQDNDENLPAGTQAEPGVGWAGQPYPYIKAQIVFRCPEDKARDVPYTVSYALNSNIARRIRNGGFQAKSHALTPDIVTVFEVTSGLADITSGDEGASRGATRFSPAGDGSPGGLFPADAQYALDRHRGRANYLFADGHVRDLPPRQADIGVVSPSDQP